MIIQSKFRTEMYRGKGKLIEFGLDKEKTMKCQGMRNKLLTLKDRIEIHEYLCKGMIIKTTETKT